MPIIIFKGKLGKRIEQSLATYPLVEKKLIKDFSQPNALCTYEIFKNWIKEIFIDYQYKLKKKCLLVLERAPSHTNEIIKGYLDNNGINYTFIPCGLKASYNH